MPTCREREGTRPTTPSTGHTRSALFTLGLDVGTHLLLVRRLPAQGDVLLAVAEVVEGLDERTLHVAAARPDGVGQAAAGHDALALGRHLRRQLVEGPIVDDGDARPLVVLVAVAEDVDRDRLVLLRPELRDLPRRPRGLARPGGGGCGREPRDVVVGAAALSAGASREDRWWELGGRHGAGAAEDVAAAVDELVVRADLLGVDVDDLGDGDGGLDLRLQLADDLVPREVGLHDDLLPAVVELGDGEDEDRLGLLPDVPELRQRGHVPILL